MPLEKGKAAIGRNVKTEEAAGKPPKQAVAIALNTAGVPKAGDKLGSFALRMPKKEKGVPADLSSASARGNATAAAQGGVRDATTRARDAQAPLATAPSSGLPSGGSRSANGLWKGRSL